MNFAQHSALLFNWDGALISARSCKCFHLSDLPFSLVFVLVHAERVNTSLVFPYFAWFILTLFSSVSSSNVCLHCFWQRSLVIHNYWYLKIDVLQFFNFHITIGCFFSWSSMIVLCLVFGCLRGQDVVRSGRPTRHQPELYGFVSKINCFFALFFQFFFVTVHIILYALFITFLNCFA